MDNECLICNNNIQHNQLPTTKCGHIFHYDCIKKWVDDFHEYPICLTKIDKIYSRGNILNHDGPTGTTGFTGPTGTIDTTITIDTNDTIGITGNLVTSIFTRLRQFFI